MLIIDMNDSSQVPTILGRQLLVTVGAVVDVAARRISFYLCGEQIEFYFPLPTTFHFQHL